MKKIIVAVALITGLTSCNKEEEGYMFRCKYSIHGLYLDQYKQHQIQAANFFKCLSPSETVASEEYKKTEAYKDVVAVADSIWIDYYCTYQEWKDKE